MNCKYHPDRAATHLVTALHVQILECDQCAEDERLIGVFEVVTIAERDSVLEAEFIDG